MSAAMVEVQPHEDLFADAAPRLVRQQAAEVLAAHRSRRQRLATDRPHDPSRHTTSAETAPASRSKRIASRVTAHYAQSQSYRSFLEAEAEEATRKARAVAEIAARTAQAVADAQLQLLHELALSEPPSPDSHALQSPRVDVPELIEPVPQTRHQPPVESHPSGIEQASRAALTVRLFDQDRIAPRDIPSSRHPALHSNDITFQPADPHEAEALDEEISFRQSPSFDLERASTPIPGNLLEFPRQLVAARKARPRYAEGPLQEGVEAVPDDAQLRIFEVDASQITSQAPTDSLTPEWSSIWLDALTEEAPNQAPEAAVQIEVQRPLTASIESRLMAAIVDTCLVGMGFVAFASVFAYTAPVLPSLLAALAASAAVLVVMYVLYLALFFTFSESTPGMRYARIGLCTLDDENPSRTAMLTRIPALALAAFPLGLGFLWACLDDDRLGWHDRLSRTYQRSY